jgi:hypothetical protein
MSDQVETGKLIPYLTEMFRFQAWMAMGKVSNPVSGKVERNLVMAREMINLLGELESRTAGNRSGDETKLLQGVLTELRLNYMDEAEKPSPEAAPGAGTDEEETPEAGSASKAGEESGAADETASASESASDETAKETE